MTQKQVEHDNVRHYLIEPSFRFLQTVSHLHTVIVVLAFQELWEIVVIDRMELPVVP